MQKSVANVQYVHKLTEIATKLSQIRLFDDELHADL